MTYEMALALLGRVFDGAVAPCQAACDPASDNAFQPTSECPMTNPSIAAEASTLSLFERLGGEAAVDAAVDIFYRKVLSDDRIGHFFDSVDMDKQAAKQKAFLTMAFGGPHHYTGLDMRRGHAHLVERGLNESHVDAVIENLANTLRDLGVAEDLIGQVAAIAESTRDDVLGR
jgi:hemoglobin